MTVLLMGGVYKFTKRAWRNFLEKWVETGEMPCIDRYSTCVSIYAPNITDIGIEDVHSLLQDLDNKK